MGADAVVDLGDDGRDVLNTGVVETVDPKTRVLTLHLALEVVESPCCVLQGRKTDKKNQTNYYLSASFFFSNICISNYETTARYCMTSLCGFGPSKRYLPHSQKRHRKRMNEIFGINIME